MMCWLCDENDGQMEACQDCGTLICFDQVGGDDVIGRAYITESGDLFCSRCGAGYDEVDDEDDDPYDFYPAAWYDPGSGVSELEPEETPRETYIGPGSETLQPGDEERDV